jgi:hypothetical protein
MTTSWEDLQNKLQAARTNNTINTISDLSKTNPELINLVRSVNVHQLVKELVNVQPMGDNVMKNLIDESMTEQELIDNGFTPVSDHGIMWIKK